MPRYRFAAFNTALSRAEPRALARALTGTDDSQARIIAEIIQRTRPDVLWLGEFDYDASGRALADFQRNYLRIGRNGAAPIRFPYALALPSNTGLPSGHDLNRDGIVGGPDDALGYGAFPGQYAFAVLSRWPLAEEHLRCFQRLLWKDMPKACLPRRDDGGPWYSDAALTQLPLSSKNHILLPVHLPQGSVYLVAAHPCPPAFDGPEQRHARRNHDELRLLRDCLDPQGGGWLRDDAGGTGGLEPDTPFVVLGDLNADPRDGNSLGGSMDRLLLHPGLNPTASTGPCTPCSRGAVRDADHWQGRGDPARHTTDWHLRVDYVLPSRQLQVLDSGVFWPTRDDPLYRLVRPGRGSDHRLVWVDVTL